MQKYKIGIYLRLSLKDRETDSESNSISVQNTIITDYIKGAEDLKNCTITTYCDDGFSGTDFERPDVKRLLNDVNDRKINCIIVKDVSRFGRSYIEVGNYLEKIFPFLGVRFISVNDDYDSNRPEDVGGLVSAFKSIFADIYSKELSVKVKTAKDNYAKQGRYVAGLPPYGYKKSETSKTQIVIDDITAAVVRLIFSEYINGKDLTQIARELNYRKIPSPLEYKKGKGKIKGSFLENRYVWCPSMIQAIIKNDTYKGSYVYAKTRIMKVGSSIAKRMPKKEWVIIEDHHEPIVEKDIFDMANAKMKSKKCHNLDRTNPIAKMSRCGICNRKLEFRPTIHNPYLVCRTGRLTDTYSCKDTTIQISAIRDALVAAVEAHIQSAVDRKKLMESTPLKTKLKSLQMRCADTQAELSRWTNRLRELLQNSYDGKIDAQLFAEQKEVISTRRMETEQSLECIKAEIAELEEKIRFDTAYVSQYGEFETLTEITDDILTLLVDEVIVYDNVNIEIKWKFSETQR